jgi:hypothetical protein
VALEREGEGFESEEGTSEQREKFHKEIVLELGVIVYSNKNFNSSSYLLYAYDTLYPPLIFDGNYKLQFL